MTIMVSIHVESVERISAAVLVVTMFPTGMMKRMTKRMKRMKRGSYVAEI